MNSQFPSTGTASQFPSTGTASHFPSTGTASHFPSTGTSSQFQLSGTASHFPSTGTSSHFPLSATGSFPSTATGSQCLSTGTASHFPSSATGSQFSKTLVGSLPSTATGSQFPSTAAASHGSETPSRFQFTPSTPHFPTVHPDVSHVDEEEIRNWSPSQVAYWMHIAGYSESTIDKFLINDITGTVLLQLQIDDLKELDISSFGKRHQLMASIDHLRETMRKTPPKNQGGSDHEVSASPRINRPRSYQMSVSPSGEVISSPARGQTGSQVTPGEFVSIVGIEQLLPKPHSCSKGENCSKYQRRQRQIEKILAENPNAVHLPGGAILTGNPGNPETAKNMLRPQSDGQPSVVASSDVFGPAQEPPRLNEEALSEVEKDDPKERMRKFLEYQHVQSPVQPESPGPVEQQQQQETLSPASPAKPPTGQVPPLFPPAFHIPHMAANLRNLPKLTIPNDDESDKLTTAETAQRTITPSRGNQVYGSPTVVQEYGPFSNAQYPSDNYYRQGTPFSEMDAPVTAIPNGPVARETSQSVPPDMRYGNIMAQRSQDPIMRSASTRPQMGTPLRRVHEGRPLTPIEAPSDLDKAPRLPSHTSSSSNSSLASDPNVTHSGYMKKRKTTRLLRHEWQDAHFTLRGTNLAMHRDEANAHRNSQALESLDVDDYAVACSSMATSSKLSAAFKRSLLRNGNQPNSNEAAFAFSLVRTPKEQDRKALFSSNKDGKSHHFAVKSREDRIDWMRELMLAKALKKGREGGSEVQVNGNFI